MHRSLARRSVAAVAVAGWVSTFAAAQTPPSEPPLDAPLDFYAAEPDLRGYVDEALERTPTVLESRARYRAARERVPQVTALPDPVVSFTQALRSLETRVGPQTNAVTLSQDFPWIGTLDLQGRVALQQAAAQYHLHQARRRDVVAQVKQAFYELAYIDAALGLAHEERLLLEHYETLARTRYATGQGLQQAVIKLQAEITRIINRRHVLDRQRLTRAAHLNALRDRPADDPVPTIRPLERPALDLDRVQLYELGDRHRQELQAAAALIRGSERSIELARKRARPSFTASVGVLNVGRRDDPAGVALPPPDNGRNAVTVSLGVSLPLWRGKYRAGIEQAAAELLAHRHQRAAARNAMERGVQDAVVRLETLDRQVELLDTVLIPQTEEALRATEAAYETGQLAVLDLLDSERMLIEIRLMRTRYVSDSLIALSDLERAVGMRVAQH